MTDDLLVARARGLWEQMADTPVLFPSNGGVAVAVSPGSQLCPPSWAGIARLGDAAVVTAPDDSQAILLRHALAEVKVEHLVRSSTWQATVPVVEVLGPAALAYLSKDGFRPVAPGRPVTFLPPGHEDLLALAESMGPDDLAESGLDEIDSPVFVVRDGRKVLAAAGYQAWPASTAHLCVLTAPRWRGRGLARQVASAAVAHALDAELLPQWRARPEASRRVATALGFREIGDQLSVRLGAGR
ncbi:GNAT family N-acetyltransferase [Streptomyces sp. NPDC056844]|uniref:GNAT family N-acetyltransferase n=1 Tax=unclassified Streptomyces TaxID=2593676 RepID=UPI00369E6796